ncbi:MAG: response regulator transcription factor [Clostridiaceae bacterium]|nr:response regulator transcription factor [Clostridiaceae bacterium]
MNKVLLVEDEKMIQELFAIYVKQAADRYEMVGIIQNAANAEIFCEKNPVDLILMDICTANDESGIDSAQIIKERFPHIKIVIVTSAPDYRFIAKSKEAGVDSFWYKEVHTQNLLEVMDKTMAGESVYPDETPELRLGNINSSDLTNKEKEVLYYVVQGLTIGEIAEKMDVEYSTSKTHIKNLREKTGAKSLTELAILTVKSRLILPEF